MTLSRDVKIDMLWGVFAGIVGVIVCSIFLGGCENAETRAEAALYAKGLRDCNATAKTLCESVACENRSRADAGRELRKEPSHCVDGGHD